ncbi:glycosyl transferase family 1 [uncultured Desulfovibrio sp.]|uniref:sulfotransferase family protein n=1 Tax=uncultured Desulfovibrio sp. TaxID=167968 RepID=UPI003207C88B
MSLQEKRHLTLVLGMHRSGTSVLARALPVLGIQLGEHLLPAHPCNPKGFFEDADINAGNRALLKELGTSWESPVSFRDLQGHLRRLATSGYGQAALAIIRERGEAADRQAAEWGEALPAPLAFKEPRMSRLLTFWRPIFLAAGCSPHVCLALRHPAHVAASLTARNGFSAAQGWRLWLYHTLDALDGSVGLPVLVADYDALLAAPEAQLRRLARHLGRPVREEALRVFSESFLDKGLRHHAAAPGGKADESAAAAGELPGEAEILLAEDMYAALRAAASDQYDVTAPAFARRLLRWRNALEALPPAPCMTATSDVGGGK